MSELILKSGPTLLWRQQKYDRVTDEERFIDLDVTANAHEYLFESATLDGDVLLTDIFKLLDAAPVLAAILRRDFSNELLVEARKGMSSGFEYAYSPEGIEFLELYQIWNLNTATREYEPIHRLDLHGIGYVLREDLNHGFGCIYPAGTRINWNISMTPVRELLALPVRFNPVVSICENDLSAKKYAQELEKVQLTGVNLGQILHGILWELSWHGTPEQQANKKAELQAQVTDIRNGHPNVLSDKDPFDDDGIFGELNEPGFRTLFLHLGQHTKKEIDTVLHDLEDDEPVQAGLRARLSDDVTIKPEFATMAARAFRTIFREAK